MTILMVSKYEREIWIFNSLEILKVDSDGYFRIVHEKKV